MCYLITEFAPSLRENSHDCNSVENIIDSEGHDVGCSRYTYFQFIHKLNYYSILYEGDMLLSKYHLLFRHRGRSRGHRNACWKCTKPNAVSQTDSNCCRSCIDQDSY